jgi:Nickel responsive protein SCO4226-like
MTTYLVECYWPGVDELQLRGAADGLTVSPPDRSNGVAWLSSILIPEDEIVLCLATGPSEEAVRETAQRAGLPAERVVSCVHVSTMTSASSQKDRQ